MVLDELMPWHKDKYDFSSLKVNRYFVLIVVNILPRPINNILGFSRETLVAVVTNIEGEWRQRCIDKMGNNPEHPRGSTSDDVECFFFSMLRDIDGQALLQKKFCRDCVEFNKCLDPDLPYFYHTSAHTRFSESPLPAFS